jgi:hypothetical protein
VSIVKVKKVMIFIHWNTVKNISSSVISSLACDSCESFKLYLLT